MKTIEEQILQDALEEYETKIGMTRLKKIQDDLRWNSRGELGKKWMALSPSWISGEEKPIPDTKYKIKYWVNYGDDTTYGWFTVEQIQIWLTDPELLLSDIGGVDEYRNRKQQSL